MDVSSGCPKSLGSQSSENSVLGCFRALGEAGSQYVLCPAFLSFSVAETSLELMQTHARASALNAFPVWEFLVGSGISLWAVSAPLVACLACGLCPSVHIPPWSCLRLSPLSSHSYYAESCPPVHFLPPSFHHLWDLASDSAPSSPRGPRPGSRIPVNTWLELRAGKGQGMRCPKSWLVATWEPFKVWKAAWGTAAVST